VHDFSHVLRVYRMAETLAKKEGADLEIVRAAALLHDAASASGSDKVRMDHHEAAAIFAEKVLTEEGWEADRIKAVQYCILTHRFRDERPPNTIEAKVLFDADKLDAIGAIGAARALAYAVLDGQPLYAEPSVTFQKVLKTEPGEPYTAYHEYLFKLSRLKNKMQTKSGKAFAEARHEYLRGFFQQLKAENKGEK
jgi:uncharacterized protein